MSKTVQFRRGTAAEHTTFTGALGEVTYDSTDKRLVCHDGSTAGGIPLAKESEAVNDKAKVSADDTTAGYLDGKLTAGTGITFTVGSPAGNETLGISVMASTYQPLDATLTALAGVTTEADKVIYATASDTFTTMTVTSAARTVLDDTSTGAMLSTLGAAASSHSHAKITLTGDGVIAEDEHSCELIKGVHTNSATNEITVTNAANGGSPSISATGSSDSNIDLQLRGKGTGAIDADIRLLTIPTSDTTASGNVVSMTAGAALAAGNLCYIGTDGKLELYDISEAHGHTAAPFAISLGTINEDAAGRVALPGSFIHYSTWNFSTVGAFVYASTTAGGVTQTATSTAGDISICIGTAVSAHVLWFNPITIVEL